MINLKQNLAHYKKFFVRKLNRFNLPKVKRDLDSLYRLLYDLTHDLDNSLDFSFIQTKDSFAFQWENLKNGEYLLTDNWFKENVDRIIWEEETQIKPQWFKGKRILDAGCGNGRWSYGFAKLGCNITAVDIAPISIDETRKAINNFPVEKKFYVLPLEDLLRYLPEKSFDLVFCWGVLHHCKKFNQALEQLCHLVKDNGILYLYLYGRETIPYKEDIELFKERFFFNRLATERERYQFLLKKAKGNISKIHNEHDIYSPLINRRLEFSYVKEFLESKNFEDVVRTIDHTELFIRAIKGGALTFDQNWFLPKKKPPYWFEYHSK